MRVRQCEVVRELVVGWGSGVAPFDQLDAAEEFQVSIAIVASVAISFMEPLMRK